MLAHLSRRLAGPPSSVRRQHSKHVFSETTVIHYVEALLAKGLFNYTALTLKESSAEGGHF